MSHLSLLSSYDHHAEQRKLVQLYEFQNLDNYYHHGSKIAIGPSFGIQLDGKDNCTKLCDAMGDVCAWFSYELPTKLCELAPRGYGLLRDGTYDFYRKKTDPSA